jgi:hypothetical protein
MCIGKAAPFMQHFFDAARERRLGARANDINASVVAAIEKSPRSRHVVARSHEGQRPPASHRRELRYDPRFASSVERFRPNAYDLEAASLCAQTVSVRGIRKHESGSESLLGQTNARRHPLFVPSEDHDGVGSNRFVGWRPDEKGAGSCGHDERGRQEEGEK